MRDTKVIDSRKIGEDLIIRRRENKSGSRFNTYEIKEKDFELLEQIKRYEQMNNTSFLHLLKSSV